MKLQEWVAIGLALVCFFLCDTNAKAKPDGKIALALKELEKSPEVGPPLGVLSRDSLLNLLHKYYWSCETAVEFLIHTKAQVEPELRGRAKSQRYEVAYRAVYILAHRGDAAAVPFLEKWICSRNPEYRYLAWDIWLRALGARLVPPSDFAFHIEAYEAETNSEIRERIESFFGATKAKDAVKPLLERLRKDPSENHAVDALGSIGDPVAVQEIIASYRKCEYNRHFSIMALGCLATPEAVDFLIEHLDEYLAPEALLKTGSEKALPALEKHLGQFRPAGTGDFNGLAATRIAIVRLKEKHPRECLLTIAEDLGADRRMRFDALSALREYDVKSLLFRILKLYIVEKDQDVKRCCIWHLQDSDIAGITEALVGDAFQYETFHASSKQDYATMYSLLKALNKRLDEMFPNLESVRSHFRKNPLAKSSIAP